MGEEFLLDFSTTVVRGLFVAESRDLRRRHFPPMVADSPSWVGLSVKKLPATLHHETIAASISSSQAMKAVDTPQAEGSSRKAFNNASDARMRSGRYVNNNGGG